MTALSSHSFSGVGSAAPRADATPADAAAHGGGRSTFWHGFWLAVVLLTCKWIVWRPPNYLRSTPSRTPFKDFSILTSADLLFVLGAALTFQTLLLLARRHRAARRIVWGSWLAFCVISVLYGIISIPVFHELRAPLTYSLISLSRNVKNMSASLTPALSWKLPAALACVPPLYLIVAWACDRFLQPQRTLLVRALQALGLIVIVARTEIVQRNYLPDWKWEPDRRLAESPHWALLRSTAGELTGRGMPRLADDFPKSYLDEFKPQPGGAAIQAAYRGATARPKNVILLVLESVGTQYLGIYGSPYDTTPNLQRELDHAVVFDNFYAHDGMTTFSLLAITNSTYPQVSWWPDTDRSPNIGGVSVPQALRSNGYRSAFITSGDLNWVGEDRFLSYRGFDHVIDGRTIRQFISTEDGSSWGVQDRHVFDAMLDWIDRDATREKPFFLVGWTLATHHPYFIETGDEDINFFKDRKPPRGSHPSLNRYLNAVRNADHKIARLIAGLRERGLADDTLVVITGDHGECFNAPHPTLCHGWDIWDENCHVPLVIWNPKLFPQGRRSQTIGGHVDLDPTILDLLSLPPPPAAWQGRSMFAEDRSPRVYFFAALGDYQVGVRQDKWKLIYNATLGTNQLYDLAADPTEQHDISAAHPKLCADLRRHIAAWLSYQDGHLAELRTHPIK